MSSTEFPKLNDTNYPTWAYRMEMLLTRKEVWEVVDGTETKPLGSPNSAAVKKWTRKARLARAEIALKVEDSQLVHTRDDDPHEIWTKLEKVHKARGLSTRMALRRKFHGMHMDSDQSMQSWISAVQDMAQRLQDLKVTMTDDDIILILTQGLPSSYDSLVVNLDATPPDDLTLDYVIARLINEESRQAGPTTTSNGNHDSVAVYARTNTNRPKRDVKFITCFGCGVMGHYVVNCPKKADGAEAANSGIEHTF